MSAPDGAPDPDTTPAGLPSVWPGTSDTGLGSAEAAELRRRSVLKVAARVLTDEGPSGLTLRHVAAEAGGSTQLIYTLFGGKGGLADALYAEGFARLDKALGDALDEGGVAPGDPEQLVQLGHAYRRFALAEPAFFALMFGRAMPGFSPGAKAGEAAGRAVEKLDTAVRACLDAGTIRVADTRQHHAATGRTPYEVTLMCWTTVHGLAALEAAGNLITGDPEEFADRTLRLAVNALTTPR